MYVDVDGVGEVVDCLRGLGLTEASDAMVCDGTVWLLEQQQRQGNWPVSFAGDDAEVKLKERKPYDAIHSTWVCTQVKKRATKMCCITVLATMGREKSTDLI